MEEVSSQVL
jgi:hypothetical protein